MTYVRSTDGTRIHYQRHRTPRRAADPVHPGPRRRQARLGPAAAGDRTVVPGGRARQPRRRPQRQAARPVLARADGRRRDRRARRRRRRHRPRRRRVDGWRDQPDRRRQVPRADPLADAGLHRRAQPSVARGAARRAGATPRSNVASASMGQEAARWVIGPRSFRRLLPALGWLGPLALGRPAHAFAAQCDAILDATEQHEELVERLPEIEVPTLVLVGNQDILTPRGDSEELADRIPTAELVVISGAAHGFMVEHATHVQPGAARVPRSRREGVPAADRAPSRSRCTCRSSPPQAADARRRRRCRDGRASWRRGRCTPSPAATLDVAVVDKGRSPGGRMATRRIGDADVRSRRPVLHRAHAGVPAAGRRLAGSRAGRGCGITGSTATTAIPATSLPAA